ncbi:phospho-sugar mutase [Aerococcaceae bacterium DSM 111022]|nr:phospho-sugar mutase [Aerococcaceae bacterium DSM 111022]MBG9988788.1 phospho-sugar mutase [Aerococcaceae bacterium DSM 111176]
MSWQDTYKQWAEAENLDADLKAQLDELSEEELEESFGGVLSFGTAGMRGILGPGPNRMNIYTVRQATEGLAKLIEDAGQQAKDRGVAIAYDSRHMSPEFAMESARVLGEHGIKSYVYESLRPTPVLSFAVRYLNAYAGIMITASHNPAAYNGYKVYGEDGGQMPPENADKLTTYVRAVENPLEVKVGDKKDLLGNGTIEMIGDNVDQAYLEEMKSVNIDYDLIKEMNDEVKIVFSPLHGTGYYIGMKALEQAGFTNVSVVKEQAEADGDFPTVTSPNPESPEAFAIAQKQAIAEEADIILATDPDADRLGAMIRQADGTYQLLTGNQIASVMLDYIVNARKAQDDLPANSVAVKSIVSTNLADAILEANGLEMVEVLTGFKFIAEKIKEYEETGNHTFLMGFEESYGYLKEPFARDKDAIQALVILAELAAYNKKAGRTLGDALIDMYEKYGYFKEKTISIDFPGLSGKEKMAEIMKSIREEGISELAGIKVVHSADYKNAIQKDAEGVESKLDYPSSDALKYQLEDKSWVAFRPSGTEPKIKLYLGVEGQSQEEVDAKAEKLEAAIRDLTN